MTSRISNAFQCLLSYLQGHHSPKFELSVPITIFHANLA